MADHDVEIRFLGDADDAALAAEELMGLLEGIKELAESLTRSLSRIEIAPSTVARFVAEAAVMESALEGVERQADDTQRALAGVALESTIGTLIGAAATGRPVGTRYWSAPQGGAPGTAMERYNPANLLLQNRVFSPTGAFPSQAAPYPYGPWSDRQKADEYRAAMTRLLGRGPGDYYMTPGSYKFTPDQMTPLRRSAYWDSLAQAGMPGSDGGDTGPSAAQVGLLAALGWGGGGGGGGRRGGFFGGMPGWLGWALGGAGALPHARMGTPLALAGLGAERIVGSTLGIAGSAVGGLAVGGGLYGLGIGGTAAVGMGTDLAGIGQAAGDIKSTTQAYNALAQAVSIYGAKSVEAQRAQQQLILTLQSFSPVAQRAVLQASMTGQSFKAMFDRFTGPAESTGAQIISQGMTTAGAFLPTLGRYAAQNMRIIQSGLQPLFSWAQKGGVGNQAGGLGIFTQLEQLFQNRLPTAVHTGTQGFELFAHAVLDAANRTGDLLPKIDAFLTKMNTPAGLQRMDALIGHMMGLFRSWAGLIVNVGHTLVDLFAPAVHLGQDFANQLSTLIGRFRQWLELGSTQSSLHGLFEAHRAQMDAIFAILRSLLPITESFLGTLIKIETVIARFTVGPLKAIADVFNAINRIPLATTLLGWGAALAVIYKGADMLFQRVAFGAKVAADSTEANTVALAANTAAMTANAAATVANAAAKQGLAAATAEADVALAAGGRTSLLSTLPFGASIGARATGLRAGLMGGIARFAGPAMVGLIGGSIASSIVTPMLSGHGTAQSFAGNALTYGGLGAGIGTAILPGFGTAIGGAAGALVGLGVSLLSMKGNSNSASSAVLTLSRSALQAASELRTARATIKATHSNLLNDRVARDQEGQQVAQDRAALRAQPKGSVGHAAAQDALSADLLIYGQTVRRIAAEENQLARAHSRVESSTKNLADAQKGLVKWTQDAARAIGNEKLAPWLTDQQKATERLGTFIGALQAERQGLEQTNPKLADMYGKLIDVANGLGRIPSRKDIAVTLHLGVDTGNVFSALAGVANAVMNVASSVGRKYAKAHPAPVVSAPSYSGGYTGPTGSSGGGGGGSSAPPAPALPAELQGAIDRAATTPGMRDDLTALNRAIAWVQGKIRSLVAAHASLTKLDPYYQILSGLQGQIGGIGSGTWSALTSQFDAMHGQQTNPGDQIAAAQQVLQRDRLAVQLDKAQSGILGGKADSSMALKVINDIAGVLASPGGKKQKYTQAEIDNWLALWGDYYASKGMTPRQMYEAFNKLLRENGLPPIDNPFSTGGLPLPPGVGSAERAAATMPLHPHHRVHHQSSPHRIHQQQSAGGGGYASRMSPVANSSTGQQPVVVEIHLEKGMDLERFLTVKVDGVVRKQGERANHRARSGRF